MKSRNISMETMIGRILNEKNFTISCAESCTGGLLTSRLTDVPGSSDYLKGSIVSYTNAVKINLLKVKSETIDEAEVVSREVAIEMSIGVKNLLQTDIGIGITGIAGPMGSTEKSPVGSVHIAISGPYGEMSEEHHLIGNRLEIKWQASEAALMLIRKYLLDESERNVEID